MPNPSPKTPVIMTTSIESSFEKLLVLLVKANISFTTVGGIAVCLNGYVRLTEDVDILVAPDSDNILNLIRELSDYGEGFASELTPADFADEEGAIRIIEAIENCQIDIFVRMQGLHLDDFKGDIQHFRASDGTQVPYLGSKSLITLKATSLREKDRVDVSVLKGLLNNTEA
jgi:hypothetical protein